VYGWLWDHLPGPIVARLAVVLLVAAAVIVVCFAWVFPWVATKLPVDNFDQQPGAAVTDPHRRST
jgi:hypothetical protein